MTVTRNRTFFLSLAGCGLWPRHLLGASLSGQSGQARPQPLQRANRLRSKPALLRGTHGEHYGEYFLINKRFKLFRYVLINATPTYEH